MSVAEILHHIEALPSEERLRLVEKLVRITEAEAVDLPDHVMTEAERLDLEEKLKQRPNLGAELAEGISRMQAGDAMELDEVKVVLQQISKLGL
jgi:hypothetical protein